MMKNVLNVTTAGDREIVITRDFDAPRALVWETMSKPDLLKRWLIGPPGWEMTDCEDEQRVGGKFRWEWIGPERAAMTMTGVYREFDPPARCVRTESFECAGMPPMGEQLATLELTESGEKTSLTLTVLYPSKEARDGALAGGMDKGLASSYDRLDEILEGVTA
jgi:uncharacterized protein YndB with AHSA1/START domain